METQAINHNADTPADGGNKNSLLVSLTQQLKREKLGEILNGKPIPVSYKGFSGGRPQSVKENWGKGPDIYRGLIRKVFHQQRAHGEDPYARMLYSEGGRTGDPWGTCNLELNGHVYHFGAGLKRYPVLLNGVHPTESASRMLGTGIPGYMECDQTDWKWVQGEVDLTQLMTAEAINGLVVLFNEYLLNPKATPIYQSQKHAEKFGIPLDPNFKNCTTIVTDALNTIGGVKISGYMPLDALNEATDTASALPANSHSHLDHALSALMCMDYIWIKRLVSYAFKNAGIKPAKLAPLTKPTAKGDPPFPNVDAVDILVQATKWLGTQWH